MLKTADGEISGSLKMIQSKKGDWTWKEQVGGGYFRIYMVVLDGMLPLVKLALIADWFKFYRLI